MLGSSPKSNETSSKSPLAALSAHSRILVSFSVILRRSIRSATLSSAIPYFSSAHSGARMRMSAHDALSSRRRKSPWYFVHASARALSKSAPLRASLWDAWNQSEKYRWVTMYGRFIGGSRTGRLSRRERARSAVVDWQITRVLELTEEEEAGARRRSRRDNRLGDIRTRLEEEDDDPDSRPRRTCHLCMAPRVSLCERLSVRGIAACPRAGAVGACRNSRPEERVRLCLDEGDRPVLPARSTACACALLSREKRICQPALSSLWPVRRGNDHALSSGLSG